MIPEEITIKLRPRSLLIGVCLSPFVVLLAWWVWTWPWSGESAPAWVQAVGSIGAILAAVWIASNQGRQQRQALRTQEAELLKKVVAIAKHVGQTCLAAIDVADDAKFDHEDALMVGTGLANASALVAEISYQSIPQAEAAIGWIELRHAVADIRKGMAAVIEDPGFDDGDRERMRAAATRAAVSVRRIEAASTGHLPELRLPR